MSGTVFLLCAVVGAGYLIVLPRLLPNLRRKRDMPFQEPKPPRIWLLGVPAWLGFFKAFHSYFVLLSAMSGTSILRVVALWLGGTMVFAIAAILLFFWYEPAIFPEVSGQEPTDRAADSETK